MTLPPLPKKAKNKIQNKLLLNLWENYRYSLFSILLHYNVPIILMTEPLFCANRETIWWSGLRAVQLASRLDNATSLVDCAQWLSGVRVVWNQCEHLFFILFNYTASNYYFFILILFFIVFHDLAAASSTFVLCQTEFLWMSHCRDHSVCSGAKVSDSQHCGAPAGSC